MTNKQTKLRNTAEDAARDLIARYLNDQDSPGMCAPDLECCTQVSDEQVAADEIVQILLDEGWTPPTTQQSSRPLSPTRTKP